MKRVRISLLILAAILLCTLLPQITLTSHAETYSGTCGENLDWTFDSGTLTIQGDGNMTYWSDEEDVPWYEIKESIKEVVICNGVTSIGVNSFRSCVNLKKVIIPNSVTSIGDGSFWGCESLTDIIIPDSVTDLGYYFTFCGCSNLKSISIPNGVSYIGINTFMSCTSLAYVRIPNSVTEIGADSFFNCTSLTSVAIPSSVTTIGWRAFGYYYEPSESDDPIDYDSYEWPKDASFTIYGKAGSEAEAYAKDVKRGGFVFRTVLDTPATQIGNDPATGKNTLTFEEVEAATAYKVYRADSKDGSYKLMKTVTDGTSYVNTSAVAGKAYWYKVKAINTDLDISSKYSAVKSRTCDLPQPVVTGTHDAATGKNKLTWKAVDGAKEYKVYRSGSKSSGYKLMKTTTELSYVNTGAKAGETWYYKVMAIHANSAANSAYSAPKGLVCDLARPVVTIALSSGKPKLTWKAIEGAKAYKVYRSESKSSGYELIKTTTSLVYTNTKAVKGKTYYYKVMAIHEKSAANSAYSLIKSIKATK